MHGFPILPHYPSSGLAATADHSRKITDSLYTNLAQDSQSQSFKHAFKINVKTYEGIQQYHNKQRIKPTQISYYYEDSSHVSDSARYAVQRERDRKHTYFFEA